MRNWRSAAPVLPAACTTEPAVRPEFEQYRAGQDSINYYWQDGDPYGYGDIVVGGSPIPGRDLCLRVYLTLNPIPATYWGMGQAA